MENDDERLRVSKALFMFIWREGGTLERLGLAAGMLCYIVFGIPWFIYQRLRGKSAT